MEFTSSNANLDKDMVLKVGGKGGPYEIDVAEAYLEYIGTNPISPSVGAPDGAIQVRYNGGPELEPEPEPEPSNSVSVENPAELAKALEDKTITEIIFTGPMTITPLDLTGFDGLTIDLNGNALTSASVLVNSDNIVIKNGSFAGATTFTGTGKDLNIENVIFPAAVTTDVLTHIKGGSITGALVFGKIDPESTVAGSTVNNVEIEGAVTTHGGVSFTGGDKGAIDGALITAPDTEFDGVDITGALTATPGTTFKNLTITGDVIVGLDSVYSNVIIDGPVTSAVTGAKFNETVFNGPVTNSSGKSSYTNSIFNVSLTNSDGDSDYSGGTFVGAVTNTAGSSTYVGSEFQGAVTNVAGNSDYSGATFEKLFTNTDGASDFTGAIFKGPVIITAGIVDMKDIILSPEDDQAILFTPSVVLNGVTKNGKGKTTMTLTAPNSIEIKGAITNEGETNQFVFTKTATATGTNDDIIITQPNKVLDKITFTPSASSLVIKLSDDLTIKNSVFSNTAVPVIIKKDGHQLELSDNVGLVEIVGEVESYNAEELAEQEEDDTMTGAQPQVDTDELPEPEADDEPIDLDESLVPDVGQTLPPEVDKEEKSEDPNNED